ncbi:MAG: tryptophan-rich sensory protein [Cyanobacteria bacterium P01_F01_bin.4]
MTSTQKQSGLGLSVATILAIIGTLLVNSLSNFFPPGGQNVGEIANTVLQGVMITPANYAFAIWGVIYIGLISYGVYQFRQRHNPDIRRANLCLITACVIQMVWIYLFTLQMFWLSVVAMVGILASLIRAYIALGIGEFSVPKRYLWSVHIPFSVYTAWISVATVVNVASALYANDWSGLGLGGVVWTVIMLLVAGAIATLVILQRGDGAFGLVFVWAYVAIVVRQQSVPAIWVTAVAIAVGLALLWAYKKLSFR